MHNPNVITSVVTPAESYDLIDLATLKTLLNITDTSSDAYFTLVIPQASTAAANYCNRVFVVETITDSFWPQRDGFPLANRGAAPPVQLSRWPVDALTSVVETINEVPTTLTVNVDFLLDTVRGQLTRLNLLGNPRPWPEHALAVTYAAGYETIPPDIVDATSRLIKAAYFARQRDPMLRSQSSPGVYEAAYWFGAGPGVSSGMAPDIAALLDNYKQPLTA